MADVLLVDDDAAFRDSLKATLEAEGLRVDTASNGVEALEKLAHDRPRVVLLDLVMPVMSGYELLDRLRAEPELAMIPVIAFSGVSAIEAPTGTAFMPKPLPMDLLLA